MIALAGLLVLVAAISFHLQRQACAFRDMEPPRGKPALRLLQGGRQ